MRPPRRQPPVSGRIEMRPLTTLLWPGGPRWPPILAFLPRGAVLSSTASFSHCGVAVWPLVDTSHKLLAGDEPHSTIS